VNIIHQETIIRDSAGHAVQLAPGAALRIFASQKCGAEGFRTAHLEIGPGAQLPYHVHDCSEAAIVLSGSASIAVQGRKYSLNALDCIHIPKGIPHSTRNDSSEVNLTLLAAFDHSEPDRRSVDGNGYEVVQRDLETPEPCDPEHIQRFAHAESYELAPGTRFFDLFAGRFGSGGICGGYGEFLPDASLPCHVHDFGESITIVRGAACCETAGRQHHLSRCDTVFIPPGYPHRFLNNSQQEMGMIWIYANREPTRTIVPAEQCTGASIGRRPIHEPRSC
jgi:quercetin dioxygenase-like cupin family protein